MSKSFRNHSSKIYILFIVFILAFGVLNVSPLVNADSKPDLIIDYLNCPQNMYEGDNVKIIVKIKNSGTKNISAGTIIDVGLYVDGILASTNSTNKGLSVGASRFVNFSWIASLGIQTQRLLSVIVDYQDKISESNENNNAWDKFVDVLERDTELKINEIYVLKTPRVNETINVYANVTNIGKSTSSTIYATLSTNKEGNIETEAKNGLSEGGNYTFVFDWRPKYFGSQTLNVKVTHEGKTHDTCEKIVFVDVSSLKWWNDSWHYRYFVMVKGSGNVSTRLNFTRFLNSNLSLNSQEFENGTIRIIQYASNGSIVGEARYYRFNESIGFSPINNATGTLIWKVTGSSAEKYYCIYFDVKNNPGNRTLLNETQNIDASGDARINYSGFVGGWWIDIIQPANNSYCPISESIDITAHTTAKAENAVAYIFLSSNTSHNFTRPLVNIGNNVSWRYENFYFDSEGNWKIRVASEDKAGYKPAIAENDFYVGKPDLKTIDISFVTNWPPTSPKVYKNDTATITAHIMSYNATVYNVTVFLSIYDIGRNTTVYYANMTNLTLVKNKDNLVNFNWTANQIGSYNVTIMVDPKDLIDELNESNNRLTKNIIVYGWPDLAVLRVIAPSEPMIELDRVRIDAVIANNGYGNASEYEVRLYIEPNQTKTMSYSETYKRYSMLVSVTMNTSKQISLFWDSATPGEWMVGVKVIITDTKRDTNIVNNQLPANVTLKVASRDRNPPVISNVDVLPDSQEQGGSVKITAKVTDDSGLESVVIRIIDPTNESYDGNMIRTVGDMFSFVFKDTLAVGNYRFTINAVDISIHANRATSSGSFIITKDATLPVIAYFDAYPSVQLKNGHVTISCIATDNIEIETVRVVIISPDGNQEEQNMTWSSEGKYVYTSTYDIVGKYSFYIEIKDKAGNEERTTSKVFWITIDKDDADNDGMPDQWEEKYGLNPGDPRDADGDTDGDGYTNLREYEVGTNPAKDIFIQNAAAQIRENSGFLGISIILFAVIVILSIYGKRRRIA